MKLKKTRTCTGCYARLRVCGEPFCQFGFRLKLEDPSDYTESPLYTQDMIPAERCPKPMTKKNFRDVAEELAPQMNIIEAFKAHNKKHGEKHV